MNIDIKGGRDNFRSDEERLAAYLSELRNDTSLSKKLREYSESIERPVQLTANVPQLPELLQAEDGLGCVIACYRMALKAQDKPDPGQTVGRNELENSGHVPSGHLGMASLSEEAAEAIGIDNPVEISRIEDIGLNEEEEEELQGKHWPARLAMAIKKGRVSVGALPMKYLYEDCDLNINHAFVIKGVKFDEGKLTFLINDPLGKASEISDDKLVAGALSIPKFISMPHARHLAEDGVRILSRMKPAPLKIRVEHKPKIRINRPEKQS